MHSTIKDDDQALRIDPSSRQVIVPAGCTVIGAQGDHMSEQLTLQCPRIVEGHDLAGCAVKWISWANAKGEPGQHNFTIAEKSAELIHFVWPVSAKVTKAAGPITFSVHFMDLNTDGTVAYKWGTQDCKALQVLPSQQHGPDAGTALAYSDEDEGGLLQVDVDDAQLNAEAFNAVREVLYG